MKTLLTPCAPLSGKKRTIFNHGDDGDGVRADAPGSDRQLIPRLFQETCLTFLGSQPPAQ